jgi:uncharacterized protein involved in outer membrane biogenesis
VGKVLRRTIVTIVLLAGLAVAVPFIVPAWSYIPEVNRLLSAQLGQSVAMQDLKLHALPTPRVVAYDVRIGKSQEVTASTLEIVPDLGSLLSEKPSLRLVRAANVQLDESVLARAFAGGMAESGRPLPFEVRRVIVDRVRLRQAEVERPAFDVDAKLAAGMRLDVVRVRMQDTDFSLAIEPQRGKGAIIKLDGELYGGWVTGAAHAERTAGWRLIGKVNISDVDLVPLQRLLGKSGQLSGRLRSVASFSAQAPSAEQLAAALEVDADFEVVLGAWRGVDLAKAVEPGAEAADGDVTRFKEFKGQVRMRNARVRIENLCLRSDSLVAGGHLDIAPEDKLSGKLSLSMPRTAGLLGVPVAVGGTVSEPTFRPSSAYWIGAAVGTVLLPGIGTGLGASAGSLLAAPSNCK